MGNMCCRCCAEPAETSSTCAIKTATAAHNLIVPSYSLLKGRGVGKFISSWPFKAGGRLWEIRFYPDGDRATGHAAAFLCLLWGKAVHTRFTLSLLLKDGKVHPDSRRSGECLEKTFRSSGDTCWGFTDFIHKSKLLHHDCFTIRCDLTVIHKPSIVLVPSTQGAGMAADRC